MDDLRLQFRDHPNDWLCRTEEGTVLLPVDPGGIGGLPLLPGERVPFLFLVDYGTATLSLGNDDLSRRMPCRAEHVAVIGGVRDGLLSDTPADLVRNLRNSDAPDDVYELRYYAWSAPVLFLFDGTGLVPAT